jgi:peptide/nickel transport system permease protein
LGFSFKKNAVVSALISERLGYTLQITLPSVILSTFLGLFWGLRNGYRSDSLGDSISTFLLIVLNAVPTFLIGMVLMIFCCFRNKWLPYTGLNSAGTELPFLLDRIRHLILPILTLTIGTVPSRYLLIRNTARKLSEEKYILYAKERGLSDHKIMISYLLKNIAQPFITMVGMSVNICVGGSLVIENIFSIPGMGKLLTEAVYSLDYPLMQGILFVTTGIMVISIVTTDILCIVIDPKVRLGGTS